MRDLDPSQLARKSWTSHAAHPARGSLEGEHGKAEEKARRPTDKREQLGLLRAWQKQRAYELVRPLVLFGTPADERVWCKRLPAGVRRLIVGLKVEYPSFYPNETSLIYYVRSPAGISYRRLSGDTATMLVAQASRVQAYTPGQ